MVFKLPIYYCKDKTKISQEMNEDLELITSKDDNPNIYSFLFQPKTKLGEKCLKKWKEYFTTDRKFLKDTQKVIKSISKNKIKKNIIESAYEEWQCLKKQENFLETHQYIEWDKIKWLNKSVPFLTALGYYNLTSPIVNLMFPLLLLFVPFFIIKAMGLPVTFKTYRIILFKQLKNHIIGKIFMEFGNVSWSKRVYLICSFGMYLFNFYQNIVSCYKFYINLHSINTTFLHMNKYIHYTIEQMEMVLKIIKKKKTYIKFKQNLQINMIHLKKYYEQINLISDKAISFLKLSQLGFMMKQYYILYMEMDDIMNYSFEFNGYMDLLEGLNKNIENGYIHKTKFKKQGKTFFKQIYYPPLMLENPVKNDIFVDINKIITGPNAAGKTTIIKSTLINLLFSQQIGYGFYDKAQVVPYDFFHCYINIPDTSGRDSLFQAEAKRCKNIIDFINKTPNKRHFCIFDELFSGTNPYEAISSAFSYLNYLTEKNVNFMLTTHYIRLCKLYDKKTNINNFNMKVDNEIFTYELVKGISDVKGGIRVLRHLKYPLKILKNTEKIIRQL